MHRLAFLSLWLIICTTSHAELYKWVDENGRTHYSDSAQPEAGAQVVALPEEIAPVIRITPEPATDTLATRQALMRKPEQRLPHIIVTAQPLGETRQAVGNLRAGEFCRKINPLYWPDIRQQRSSLAPTPAQLTSAVVQALSHFDYTALNTDLGNALNRQRQAGGPLLQLQVVKLELDACAPDHYAGTRAYEPGTLTDLNIRRHQLQLTADWTLIAVDGSPLFTGQTSTRAGSMQHDEGASGVFRATLEQAVMQLLANPAFQAGLQKTAVHSGQPLPTLADRDWSLADLLPGSWQRRANLAALLAAMSQVKAPMTEYYMNEGEWPTHFEQMQLDIAPSVQGATLILQPGGEIVAHLPDGFGEGKQLRLRAPVDPTVIGAAWTCETNVDERPEACSGL